MGLEVETVLYVFSMLTLAPIEQEETQLLTWQQRAF